MRRIGVLINTVYAEYSVTFLRGIEWYCSENNCAYYVFPLAHGNNSGIYDYHYETLLQFITKNNIDGLVIATASLSYDVNLSKLVRIFQKLPQMPKISAGMEIEGIPTLKIDCAKALKELCEHLVQKHNVKKPLVLRCAKGNFESDDREKVVVETFNNLGINLDDDRVLSASFLSDTAYKVLSKFLKTNGLDFDAVVCLNDTMAMGVCKCLAENEIRIPQDVIVTGFDNIVETSRDELNITTVDQRIEDLGFIAATDLCAMIDGTPAEKLKLIAAKPVFRGSCGCDESGFLANSEEQKKLSRRRTEVLSLSGIQLYMLHYFLMETQTPVAVEDLYSRLHYCLALFDIRAFVLVLYDKPVFYEKDGKFQRPDTAKTAMTFFNGDSIERPEISFNPNNCILPPKISEQMEGGYRVFPVFAETLQYGYLLFRFGQYEGIFYQTVFELIAKEVVTAIKISLEQREKDTLKTKNVNLEQYSQKLHELSFTDDMTGLLNRRGFYEYARRKVSASLQSEKGGLVIYCDMDGLKKINDTYGHDAGDRAIQYEARVLKSIFRSTDVLGRLGGDEFAIVAEGMKAKDFPRIKKSIAIECEKINKETMEPFILSLSSGYTEYDSEKNNIDELLSFADSSQYEDKRAKKEREKQKKKSWFGRK